MFIVYSVSKHVMVYIHSVFPVITEMLKSYNLGWNEMR